MGLAMTAHNKRTTRIVDDIHSQTLALRVGDLPVSAPGAGDSISGESGRLVVIEAIAGSPEGRALGTIGDIRIQSDAGAIWQKTSGAPRTDTGWTSVSGGGGALTYGTPVGISTNASVAGILASVARADHTHQLTSGTAPAAGQVPQWNGSAWVAATVIEATPGGVASPLSAGSASAAGVSADYSREDHAHAVPVAAAVAISGNANTDGASGSLARADHTHQLTTAAPAAGQIPQWSGAAWVASTIAVPVPGGSSTTLVAGATSAAGVGTSYSREDHAHAVPVATAVAISGNANGAGASTSLARADHTHQLTSGAAPAAGQVPQWDGANWVAATVSAGGPSAGGAATTLVPGAASASGVSADYSREDHSHAVPVAAAATINTNLNAEGVSASLARADHTHEITANAPVNESVPQWNSTTSVWEAANIAVPIAGSTPATLLAGSGNLTGVSNAYSRQDHRHSAPTGPGVTISSNVNGTGNSSDFARANHTHQLTNAPASTNQVPQWNGASWAPFTVSDQQASGYVDIGTTRVAWGTTPSSTNSAVVFPGGGFAAPPGSIQVTAIEATATATSTSGVSAAGATVSSATLSAKYWMAIGQVP